MTKPRPDQLCLEVTTSQQGKKVSIKAMSIDDPEEKPIRKVELHFKKPSRECDLRVHISLSRNESLMDK